MASPLLRFHTKLAELRGMKPLTEPPPRYAEWIDFCFGRLERLDPADDSIATAIFDGEFRATDAEIVDLFEVTMRRSGADLAKYSNAVLGGGLSIILDAAVSDISHAVRRAAVAKERKVNAVSGLRVLYDEILTPRAKPFLGHLSEAGNDRLSYVCYMLWDVTGLAHWAERDEADAVPQAILEVLEHALASPNDAVIESGLHGLGHLVSPKRAKAAVDTLLVRRPDLRLELKRYAEACSLGCIQ